MVDLDTIMDTFMDAIKDLNIDVVVLIRSFYLLVAAGVLVSRPSRLFCLFVQCEHHASADSSAIASTLHRTSSRASYPSNLTTNARLREDALRNLVRAGCQHNARSYNGAHELSEAHQ